MRVLITGGAGYVGSALTAHLLGCGFEVTVFDNLSFGAEAVLAFAHDPSFRLHRGDLRERDAVEAALAGCDAVVHLGAIVGEEACARDPAVAESVNRDAAIELFHVAARAGVDRCVVVSTCSNYGVSDPGTLADEETPLRPLSLYARTKVEAERAALRVKNLRAVVLRLGTICGLSPRMRFDLLVNDMARAAARGDVITIYKPLAWRPFLHVGDAARAVRRILEAPNDAVVGNVYNVVGENYQKEGLARVVRKNFPSAQIVVTQAAPDDRDYRVSGARIERELGYKPVHTVEGAFLEVARAVADGVFVDPMWPGHSALPYTQTGEEMAV